MKREKEIIKVRKFPLSVVISMFVFVLLLSLEVNAQTSYIKNAFNTQTYQPSFNTYYSQSEIKEIWPMLYNPEECKTKERQDFILNIRPGSCMPAVVRSDLLEEQSVRVYCQVDAIKLNPLIDVSAVKSVSFKGEYPDEVLGAGFHPAQAALKVNNKLLTNPILNNLGYVVVYLKSMPEKDMPDSVEVNLTGYIKYDMENAFGTGQAQYYLPILTDEKWKQDYKKYGFWKGKGYIRAEYIHEDEVKISVYRDADEVIDSFVLKQGQTSDKIYLPNFYCLAGVQVKLDEISYPEISALLDIDGTSTWVREGSSFLDKCRVLGIEEGVSGKEVQVKCYGNTFDLVLKSRPASFEFNEETVEKSEGDKIGDWSVVYVGKVPDSVKENGKDLSEDEKNFVVLAKPVETDFEFEGKISSMRNSVVAYLKRGMKGIFGSLGASIAQVLEFGIKADKEIEAFKKGVRAETYSAWIARTKLKYRGGRIGAWFGKIAQQEKTYFSTGTNENELKVLVLFNKQGHEKYEKPALNSEKKEEIIFNGLYEKKDESLEEKVKNYFEATKEQAYDLSDKYQKIKSSDDNTYGELALFKTSELAGDLKQEKTQSEIYEKLIEKYPESNYADEARDGLEKLGLYDYSSAENTIQTGDGWHTIKLIDIKEPTPEDISAELTIKQANGNLIAQDKFMKDILIGLDEGKLNFLIKDIKDDHIILEYYYTTKDGIEKKQDYTIKLKKFEKLGDYYVKLENINLKQQASVTLLPSMPNMESAANITFRIGIEKRAIQLSPEKTQEMIKNLDKSIKEWESIIANLGNLISGFKGACFATTAYLMIKNFWSNMGGGVQARQEVMKKWYSICEDESKGDKSRFNSCLVNKNSLIETDVKNYKENLDSVNDNVKDLQKLNQDEKGNIKQTELRQAYISHMRDTYGLDEETLKKASFENLRDLELAIKNSGMGGEVGKIGADEKERILTGLEKLRAEENKINTIFGTGKWKVSSAYTGKVLAYHNDVWTQENENDFKLGIYKADKKIPVQAVEIEGKGYLAVLESSAEDKYGVSKWYSIDDNGKTLNEITEGKEEFKKLENYYFVRGLSNQWKTPEGKTPEVRFYGSGAYKGLAYVVPLGKELGDEKGWYVATKPLDTTISLETVQQKKSYTEAGIPQLYYIGNVGQNGIQEFDSALIGAGDDHYQSVTAGSYPRILGLSEEESVDLIRKAEKALREANSQYREGITDIIVLGGKYKVGAASVAAGIKCTDYMSPSDCLWLFNLCDPVMCPSSRCDAGGKYPVDNVVQSGIIGSIFLCLPNWNEGIKVPICLSGIHAGLEGYVSILKAHRDCLQESLDTGKYVGICDEIYSIYLCEFFWRQAAPLMKIAIPSVLGMLKGEGVRGGHEYLTIQDSWKNLENSIDYFRNYYAVESYKAFVARSTDEVGTEICKGFISQRYPTGKNFFDNLLKPDSPVQFHAWFDEIVFSEATVPATSHYKVYYHIYAGEDAGVYYSVYLKEPTKQPDYYSVKETMVVQTGYLPKGETLDEAKDFTGPQGYKQLCVRINGKDECGFKQVSTSYALNYLKDKYVQEQVTENIRTEQECISGTESFLPIIQPNIQEGVEQAIKPNIYDRGIIRVCATDNPGKGVDSGVKEEQRWQDVGYCGNEKVRCWVDTESVEEAIKHKGIEQETLGNITKVSEKIEKDNVLSQEDFSDKINLLRNMIKNLEFSKQDIPEEKELAKSEKFKEIIDLADKLMEMGELEENEANALYLKFELYARIVELLSKDAVILTTPEQAEIENIAKEAPKSEEKTVETAETEKGFSLDSSMNILKDGKISGFYLEPENLVEINPNYFIMKKEGFIDILKKDIQVGAIIKGRITISKLDEAADISELDSYSFESNKFNKK